MNKMILAFFLIFVVFMGACTNSCTDKSSHQTKTLRIGTNANFPPFETIDEKGKLIGFDIDFGRALANNLGMEAQFKEFDFDALILALEKGQIDIILSGMSITESRQKEIVMIPYHGEPLTKVAILFWQNAPAHIMSFLELKNYALSQKSPVSVQSGNFLEEFLRKEGIPVKTLIGPPEQVLDIKYGKSLAAAVDIMVGEKLAGEHQGLKNLVLDLPKDKWDLGYGIGINKTRIDLIDKLKAAVETLKTDGTLQNLKDRWFKGGHS